ncbi:MAG: DUF1295 domain-containing protein [Lewinellaceae bacterium]|nr:DUF1295 domain-containing protein [Saprospiraceae bacterium]MCB9312381.1 DUF1295 domain-containing protein [Lewinellaceae bacterium]
MEILATAGLIILVYATGWYILSLFVRRNDIADIAWGLGYVVLCGWLILTRPVSPVFWLIASLIVIWGVRLAWHIGRRLIGKPEDFRYRKWREEWGSTFYWRSYLQVYLLQGLLLVIIAMPILVAAGHPEARLTGWSWLAAGIWLAGFLIQAIADAQLASFVRHRASREDVLDTGLWRYSRHPNYFGEILMWWAIWAITIPLPGSWLGIVGPVTITWLLVFVSGVPMLEKRYAEHTGYQGYRKRTSMLIPWWPDQDDDQTAA